MNTEFHEHKKPSHPVQTLVSNPGLCIYHAHCADGFSAALAVWLKYGDDWEYIEAQYGNEPPDVTGRDVLIVDFSYPREKLEKMYEQANSLIVIDHHKTAEKQLAGLHYCIFDMQKSGAVLTWEHLFPGEKIPLLFQYVQDRDLWQWKMANSKEVSAALRLEKPKFLSWKELLDNTKLFDLIKTGEVVLQYQHGCIKAVTGGDVGTIELDGYTVPCTNCTHLISEIVGALAENAPFAVGYFDTKDRRVFSLRSRNGGVDVAEIAKKYGGGGHAQAAGFWIPLPKLM